MKTHPPQRDTDTQDAPPAAVFDGLDGALGMLVEYCVRGAFRPQPFLALGASITAIGALSGRRYASPSNLRTNFYTLGAADSGSGKDYARQCIARCFQDADLARYLGGNRLASSQGLRESIAQHPSRLYQLDEAGHMFGGMSSKGAASHEAKIMPLMTELFTSAGGVMLGAEHARQTGKEGRARVDLYQPHCCIYATTTAATMWKALRTSSLSDGFLARWILFLTPNSYPDANPSPFMEAPPPALVEALKAIAAGMLNHDYGGNLAAIMDAAIPMTPYPVTFDGGAERVVAALVVMATTRLRASAGTFETSFIGRHVEKIIRLAMVKAISRCPTEPVVTEADVAWGDMLASYCLATALREAGANVADKPGRGTLAGDPANDHEGNAGRDQRGCAPGQAPGQPDPSGHPDRRPGQHRQGEGGRRARQRAHRQALPGNGRIAPPFCVTRKPLLRWGRHAKVWG